jgi:uncharacterized membrane-anchored protein
MKKVRDFKSLGRWKRSTTFCLVAISAVFFTFALQCRADEPSLQSAMASDPVKSITWVSGPQRINFSEYAIDLPSGYRMTDAHGARIILDTLNQPAPDDLVGIFSDNSGKWWALLEYTPKGFVKTDISQLNATAILNSLQVQSQADAQAATALNWQSAPSYDPETHSLAWSMEIQTPSGKEVKQAMALLGRNGVFQITAYQPYPAADATSLKQLAGSVNFKDGERYADYQNGDQIFQAGLAGLITGENHAAKTGISHGFSGAAAGWVYSGIAVCAVFGCVMLLRTKKTHRRAHTSRRVEMPARTAASHPVPAINKPAAAVNQPVAAAQPGAAPAPANGQQNGAVLAKASVQKKHDKHFHRSRRKKVFNYPKFYTNVMRELSLHSYGPGVAVTNGKSGSNGHHNGNGNSNGHANGHSNGHSNGHANGNGNGANGVNETIKAEIAQLIASQKTLIEEQKCLLEQQTKLIAEKRWLIEEQTAFLKGQVEQQFPLKFE